VSADLDTDALAAVVAAVVAAALGRPLDTLTATEAIDVAERLRAIAAALDGPGAPSLTEAADLIERAAGVT